jgi:hypothetical protein
LPPQTPGLKSEEESGVLLRNVDIIIPDGVALTTGTGSSYFITMIISASNRLIFNVCPLLFRASDHVLG